MSTIIPFISHVEKQITPEQALQIAQILGLPMELSFISLTIDESLTLKAFARGCSESQPFHWNSVPFNFLAYQTPPPPPAPPAPQVPELPQVPPFSENENEISETENAILNSLETLKRLRPERFEQADKLREAMQELKDGLLP